MIPSKSHSRYRILDFTIAVLGSLALHGAVLGLGILGAGSGPARAPEPTAPVAHDEEAKPLPAASAPPSDPLPPAEEKTSSATEDTQEPVDLPATPKPTPRKPVVKSVRHPVHKTKAPRAEAVATAAKGKRHPKRHA